MVKNALFAAVAFSFVAFPALAGERNAVSHDVRPVAQVATPVTAMDLERSGEEAWFPGCLATSIVGGVSAISACSDAWTPGCLAVGVITMVDGVTACAN